MSGSLVRFYVMSLCAGGLLCGCSPKQESVAAPTNAPLAAYQDELLDFAFEMATAIPLHPHIKDRSKKQFEVVREALELDQPERVLACIPEIANWRRGAALADYAFYCAENGVSNDLSSFLSQAEEVALAADQDWRRDRIKVRIAQTYLLLNQGDQALQYSRDLEPSETGKINRDLARQCAEDDFDRQLAALTALISSGDHDLIQNALKACAALYDRFYEDAERRAVVEEKIKGGWETTPYFHRIELLSELADCALNHADADTALRLIQEGDDLLNGSKWPAEYRIPAMVQLAALRFRCGQSDLAYSILQDALARFDDPQAGIMNIDQADVLIPVAEAYEAMGDFAAAMAVYRRAVDAAVVNPNSRPQAEDLVSICLSLAKNNQDPDEALMRRITECRDGLGDPW